MTAMYQDIRVSILTCPGREKHALATASAFCESGLLKGADHVIYSDGESQLPGMYYDWILDQLWSDPDSRGNLAAFERILTLSQLMERKYHIYLEDDIRPCRNALERMCAVGVPDFAPFTTFFDMKEFYPGTPKGLYKVPLRGIDGRGFWGLQACMFDRKAIAALHAQGHIRERRKILKSHSDMVLIEALEQLGYTHYAAHVPSLVEHIGYNDSAIWAFDSHDISRRATNFLGEDFDALTSFPIDMKEAT